MLFDSSMLFIGLGIILLSSVLFTNAIEVLGERLGMHQGSVGSILAAVGTALPETIIPLIAILWVADAGAKDVAVGAIAGAPFMLATLGFFVTGGAVLFYGLMRRRLPRIQSDIRVLVRDLSFFVVLYAVAILATFVHDYMAARIVIAVALVASYALYVKVTLSSEAAELEDVEHLTLARILHASPNLFLIWFQVVASLAIMVAGGHMFIVYVEQTASLAGISPLVLSLILTPIATELPEKFNSIIWVGRGKDTLALGNITGAMVFQCSFPVAFGIIGTPWNLFENHGVTMLSALIALASALFVLIWAKTRRTISPYVLMGGGLLYLIFMAYVLTHMK